MKKKSIAVTVILLVMVVIIFSIGTYAYWRFGKTQENHNTLATECFDLSFSEDVHSGINLIHAYPITDEEAMDLKPYVAHITNKCSNELDYQMNLEILKDTTLKEEYVKVRVNEEEIQELNTLSPTETLIKNATKSYILKEGKIEGSSTIDLNLRIWLKGSLTMEDTEAMSKEFYSKVSIYGSYNNYRGKYTEDILNGADPVLKDGLIPVTINDDGSVYKADTTTEWYSYKEKQWANAVILENEEIEYQNGEEIPESNIESYFVWIPRYRYQIFNDGLYYELSSINNNAPQEIKIEFESKEKRASDGVRKGQWLTHPAFTSFDVNGLWVGKFETGYKGATQVKDAEQNIEAINKVEIKPNVYSWRNIQVANAHLNSFNYKREYDSHMMKNTEWGAVAYLSHSQYGTCTDGVCQEVYVNNNSDFITGYVAVNQPTTGHTGSNISCKTTPEACNEYGTTSDVTRPWTDESMLGLASTTGNISGVYDMAGGSWEYVMGVMISKDGKLVSGHNSTYNSNFIGVFTEPQDDSNVANQSKKEWTEADGGSPYPNNKYYDIYSYSDNDFKYQRRILGDATGEMGPFMSIERNVLIRKISSWNDDEAWFISNKYPWITRGDGFAWGSEMGLFAFLAYNGRADHNYTFRIVLAL